MSARSDDDSAARRESTPDEIFEQDSTENSLRRRRRERTGYAERLIGTLRRECLDQVVIFGETHLRRILSAYAAYYNQARTHLALEKDAPLHRAVQRSGTIVAIPILAGLRHQYVRI